MTDTIAGISFLAFFAVLIYSIWTAPARSPQAPPPEPPSPVRLFCSICRVPAALVTSQEYARIAETGVFVHCESCLRTIEGYRKQRGELS